MEVYILEFAFFDQSEWKEVHYEITAISFEQLKEKFFDIVNNTGINSDYLWHQYKDDVLFETLTFPIVKKL